MNVDATAPSNHEIENPLDKESTGVVYKASHVSFHRPVALKTLLPTLISCQMSPKEKPDLQPGLTGPALLKFAMLEKDIMRAECKPPGCRLPWG